MTKLHAVVHGNKWPFIDWTEAYVTYLLSLRIQGDVHPHFIPISTLQGRQGRERMTGPESSCGISLWKITSP